MGHPYTLRVSTPSRPPVSDDYQYFSDATVTDHPRSFDSININLKFESVLWERLKVWAKTRESRGCILKVTYLEF